MGRRTANGVKQYKPIGNIGGLAFGGAQYPAKCALQIPRREIVGAYTFID